MHQKEVLIAHSRADRIGRIRFADERLPPIWLWNRIIHLPGGLPVAEGDRAEPEPDGRRAD